ncbi:MAG: MBL fold metallo-hydrolase [Thermoplasmatales archaeon]|nr:MBL fold metallo-hydrolase [Thermoplasmatales archaeon]
MEARVTCVYDEGSLPDTALIGAKGFSLLVDVDGKRVLFDTGLRGRYLMHNLGRLKIPLDSLDCVVVSHNHRRNVGGLSVLLSEREEPIAVYAPPGLAETKTALIGQAIPGKQAAKAELVETDGWARITDRLALSPSGESGERFLLLSTAKGPVVLVACCHDGLPAVLAAAESKAGKAPHAVIGGIHAQKTRREKTAAMAREVMEKYGGIRLVLNGCTGYDGIHGMRDVFGLDGVGDFYVGMSIAFKTSPETQL